ncbi:cyclic GMP-AMP synthase isoform X2 [Xenopus laevis]|uniref:Cyclic GMP-AMP synthase isoform X2 n=1 Tax=Xenopus laevis TaxID=8355 RepID=A0A8J0U3Y2_XENLA|nr:cyclic GMP-AMP synthase isoform X2 [Xenopus laevis]
MSINSTPDKAGAGTMKQILKDTEGVRRLKATDKTKKTTEDRKDGAKKEANKKPGEISEKTSAGSRINGVSDKGVSTAGNAIICERNNGALNNVNEESVSAVRKAATGAESKALHKEPVNKGRKAKGNGEENKAGREPVNKAKKAAAGRGNRALDKADVGPGAVRKVVGEAAAGRGNRALDKADIGLGAVRKVLGEAAAGRGNRALDKADVRPVGAGRKAFLGEENKVLDKADVKPVRKGRKAKPDGGKKALDEANVEPVNMAREVERGNLAPTKLTKHLKHAVDTLKLRLCEISAAAEKVNKLVNDIIIPVLCKDPAFEGTEILKTGSYYEKVKISKPNEFDIMLKKPCEGLRITESNVSGGYYTLNINRKPKHPLTKYVENGNISGQKLLNRLRELIKSELNKLVETPNDEKSMMAVGSTWTGMDITVERKNPTSPAVTILIGNHPKISVDLVLALEVKGSWPPSTSEGMKIETWLGAKVKRDYKFEPMIFVAKQLKNTEEVLWRISFSHIEKEILMNHGNAKTCCEIEGDKCCRKQCLKLMKYLLEQLKSKGSRNMTHFCSYHAKTALLHSCTLYPKDNDWRPEDLAECFGRYIKYFITCLKTANLPNFFIPSLNLFSEDFIPINCLNYLRTKLEEQMRQDYPLVDQ